MNLEFLHAFCIKTGPWLWRASWQGGVIIAMTVLIQWGLRRKLGARWRHALWMIAFVRLVLPFTLESPVSFFNVLAPVAEGVSGNWMGPAAWPPAVETGEAAEGEAPVMGRGGAVGSAHWLSRIWLAGSVGLLGYVVFSSWQLGRRVRCERPVTDPDVLNLLEDCKQEMNVTTPLVLVETSAVGSPALLGFVRPRLLLPRGLTCHFSRSELRYLFLHELGHVKRWDVPLNWLATIPLVVHWFNPLVWYAYGRMRVDGELACDALALSYTKGSEAQSYGNTLIKLLESFRLPAVGPGMVGILENNNQMKERISMIARFKTARYWPVLAASVFGVLTVATLTDAQTGGGGGFGGAGDDKAPPKITATSPRVGATEVDPGLKEITVTFDRDMAGGFSWTGGGPEYPTITQGQKPQWRDKRTCVLPVTLQPGRYYRVGINSTSYQNFRSAAGVPAQPSAIYFTTQGASAELQKKATKPQIVGLTPKNGDTNVDPSLTELRVTFNVPMGGGFSWTGGGPEFPTIPEGKKPEWKEGNTVCVLPVQLEPGHTYRLGLNSPSHKNFQSAGGVPLDPVSYTFKTRN